MSKIEENCSKDVAFCKATAEGFSYKELEYELVIINGIDIPTYCCAGLCPTICDLPSGAF